MKSIKKINGKLVIGDSKHSDLVTRLAESLDEKKITVAKSKTTGGKKMDLLGKLGGLGRDILDKAKDQAKNAGSATVADKITEVVNARTGNKLSFLKELPVLGDIQSLAFTAGAYALVCLTYGSVPITDKLVGPVGNALKGKLYEFSKEHFTKLEPMINELYCVLSDSNLLEPETKE